MSRVSISINYAIMIEKLRNAGVENDQLIEVLKQENYEFLNQFGNGMPSWENLVNLCKQNEEDFKKIIQEGYQITFLTKGSLMTLLRFKYGIEVEKDYEDKGTAIEGILLSDDAVNDLKDTLAINWKLTTYIDLNDNLNKIRIELAKGTEFATL